MLKRMAIVPFEMAIAALLILSGISGLVHVGISDPVLSLLPIWEGDILNIASILSGLLMFFGVASGKGRVELPGLILLNGVILSRFLLFGHLLGYGANFFQTGIFDFVVVIASMTRARSIRKDHVIVRLKEYDSSGTYNDVLR